MDPNDWKRREECARRDREERDKMFEKTLTAARTQSAAIRMMIDEEEHAEKKDDMRAAYLQHGTGFDPYQIQRSGTPTSHYQEVTGSRTPVSPFNVLLGLEDAIVNAHAELQGRPGQLVEGVRSPPRVTQSQRSASDILSMSPPGSTPRPQMNQEDDFGLLPASSCLEGYDDMRLTPTVETPRPTQRGRLPEQMTGQYDHNKWYRSPYDRRGRTPRPQMNQEDDFGLLPASSCLEGYDDMRLTPTVETPRPTQRGRLPEQMTGQYDHNKWYRSPYDRRGRAPGYDNMVLTPPVRTTTSLTTLAVPVSQHQALLERARRTVENATRKLNISPSSTPHPLSHGFSTQRRQPLATLYMDQSTPPADTYHSSPPAARPTRSMPVFKPPADDDLLPATTFEGLDSDDFLYTATSSPQAPAPSCPSSQHRSICPAPSHDSILDDPRLQYRSRLSPSGRPGQDSSPISRPLSDRGPVPGTSRAITSMSLGAVQRRPASASPSPSARPTRQSVQAAAAAGTLRGTQAEMEAMGFHGRDDDEMAAEWGFADQHILPYQEPPPQVAERAGCYFPGLFKQPGAVGGKKKRVMLKRKVVKITIPPRSDSPSQEMPYMYTPHDPQYSVSTGELLPPRRLTPSPPPNTSFQTIPPSPRTIRQMQIRRDLEADWQRREPMVPSREYPEDKKKNFGKPLPKSFTTGKPKKLHSYRGGTQGPVTPQPTPSTSFGMAMGGTGRPQAPTTRTGLKLRAPSATSRGRSVPSRGGRGGTGVAPRRGASAGPSNRGGLSSQGQRGRGSSPSPTRDIPKSFFEENCIEVSDDGLECFEERDWNISDRIVDMCNLPSPEDILHELFCPEEITLKEGDYGAVPSPYCNLSPPITEAIDCSPRFSPCTGLIDDPFSYSLRSTRDSPSVSAIGELEGAIANVSERLDTLEQRLFSPQMRPNLTRGSPTVPGVEELEGAVTNLNQRLNKLEQKLFSSLPQRLSPSPTQASAMEYLQEGIGFAEKTAREGMRTVKGAIKSGYDEGKNIVNQAFEQGQDILEEGIDIVRDLANEMPDPIELIRQGFNRVRERLKKLEELAMSKVKDLGI